MVFGKKKASTYDPYAAVGAAPAAAPSSSTGTSSTYNPYAVTGATTNASSSGYGAPAASTYDPYANMPASSSSNSRPPAGNPSYNQRAQQEPSKTYGSSSHNNTPMVQAIPAGGNEGYGNSNPQYGASNGGNSQGLVVSQGNPTQCHKVDYEIKGNDMQLVEIELDQGETCIAEAGAMMYMEDGIEFKTKFGDGSEPKQGFFKKLMSAGGRIMTGESLFVTHFTNTGGGAPKARVAFAAPYPGTIVPIDMSKFGNKITCQRDAFLCAAKGTAIKMTFNKKIGSGLFGGEGFILQKLKGDGMAFMHAGGTVIRRELRGGRIRLDTGCLVGFTEGINYDIQMAPGLKTMIFGGEGLFLVTLQGTGTVWMQSLPFSRMADRIVQSAPSIGGNRKGEGSALMGGFGGLLDGDGF